MRVLLALALLTFSVPLAVTAADASPVGGAGTAKAKVVHHQAKSANTGGKIKVVQRHGP